MNQTYLQKRSAKHHTHLYVVNPKDPTEPPACHCGKPRGSKRVKPGTYNAIRCRYNGYWYDSRFEAQKAMELDWLLKAGKIKAWQRQFPIEIRDHQGKLIRRHKVDFRAHLNDDSYELIETKGWEDFNYKGLKRLIVSRWLPEHPDYSYTVVK
jgi:hypothetical protein